jgi:hypothetical protein
VELNGSGKHSCLLRNNSKKGFIAEAALIFTKINLKFVWKHNILYNPKQTRKHSIFVRIFKLSNTVSLANSFSQNFLLQTKEELDIHSKIWQTQSTYIIKFFTIVINYEPW